METIVQMIHGAQIAETHQTIGEKVNEHAKATEEYISQKSPMTCAQFAKIRKEQSWFRHRVQDLCYHIAEMYDCRSCCFLSAVGDSPVLPVDVTGMEPSNVTLRPA